MLLLLPLQLEVQVHCMDDSLTAQHELVRYMQAASW